LHLPAVIFNFGTSIKPQPIRIQPMSTGHRRNASKTDAELYQMLGQGDTSALYAKKVALDTAHDIPYAGGVSVDGKMVYIVRRLYGDVIDGNACRARNVVRGRSFRPGSSTSTRKSPSTTATIPSTLGAHGFGTAKEHAFVRLLRVDPKRYEGAIAPALDRCAKRDPHNPPRDLWCGPYLDQPTARDQEILRIFRAKGVADAFKASKLAVEYGIGAEKCRDCRHFAGGRLGECEKVCGLVRWNRRCDWYSRK
jgi:hypothetical protein